MRSSGWPAVLAFVFIATATAADNADDDTAPEPLEMDPIVVVSSKSPGHFPM